MLYGLHRDDRAWCQSEDEDQPTAAEIELELLEDAPRIPSDDPNAGSPNALIDSPAQEDWYIDQYAEELLSEREPEEPNPYHGTMYDYDDDAPY